MGFFWGEYYRYAIWYKGFVFYTDAKERLAIPEAVEMILVGAINMPRR